MAVPTAGFLQGRGTSTTVITDCGWRGRSSGPMWRVFAVCVLALLLAPPLLGTPAPVGAAGWQGAGQLPASYAAPLAALLPDGRVLAVAETNGTLYSFDDNTWSATAPLPQNARGAELIVLSDGRALLTGGAPSTFLRDPFALTRQVQRFDPAKNSWANGADMPTGRSNHTMTALPNGKMLVVGGFVGGLSPRQPTTTVGAVELYDPATDSWTPTAPLLQARYGHSATLLADGRVLVVGGAFSKTVNSENAAAEVVSSAEIYDPATGKWQAAAPLRGPHAGHTATMLLDGTVLIVGGNVGAAMTAERYTPQTNRWASAGSPATGLSRFTTTLLLSGEVVLVGGTGVGNKPVDSTVSFAPSINEWRTFSSLSRARTGHAAVLVNGHVLVIGGEGTAAASSAERYDATPLGTTCYGATGRCVGGAFLTRWQQHGQLPINGYPLGNPFPEQLGDGAIHLVQYFERVRMEAHPQNAAPNDVLLGQFGRALHPADPAVPSRAGARYFDQTGHNLDADFLAYWQANGELSQFGFPLTEVFTETLEDGKPYRVQYFERARFEYHPENAAPYNVLLGQFGRRILAGR